MVIIPDPSLTRFFFSAEIIRSAASCMDAVGGRKVSPYGCATIMLLCYALQVRTAEDVCPYGLCLFRCLWVGVASRRDARQCHTDCASFVAVRWVLLHGGTRGPALRVCASFGALRWVMPFGGTRGPALRVCASFVVVGSAF